MVKIHLTDHNPGYLQTIEGKGKGFPLHAWTGP
jgi:hypothetical protein